MIVYEKPSEGGSRPPESNQDILSRQSPEVQKIIESDPILAKHLDQITNPEEFFGKLSQNTHIFAQTDNANARKTFLEQGLKGLGYGQYTKDGRDFAKLTEEEVDGLSDVEFDAYNKWKIAQKRATIVSKKIDGEKLDTTIVSVDKENAEKNQATIKMNEKLDNLKGFVKSAQESLNSEGKNLVESQVNKIKSDPRTLQTLGIPQGEVNNPKYETLLQASALRGLGQDASFIERCVDVAKQKTFKDSIDEIGKLGIVGYEVTVKSISAHIDSRFPRSEATERAKGEITRSIETGNVSNIYYDGKGEKYTLIDRDGKTSKEVYMNPPRIRVIQSGFEAEQVIVPTTDTEKRAEKLSELSNERQKTGQKIGAFGSALAIIYSEPLTDEKKDHRAVLAHPDFGKNFQKMSDVSLSIEARKEGVDKLIQVYKTVRDEPTIYKDAYERKIVELDEIKRSLEKQGELQGAIGAIPSVSNSDFERNAKANFTTLSTDPRLYHRFPRAQELLTGILDWVNKTRDPQNQLHPGGHIWIESDRQTLDNAYSKIFASIGSNASILRSAEIGNIKPKIDILLQGNSEELKEILGDTKPKQSEPS